MGIAAKEVRVPNNHDRRARRLIAEEAARVILDEGINDYRLAKRKAAQRLGLSATHSLPRNLEIEDAVRDRQRLFMAQAQQQHLTRLRNVALTAMRLFEPFAPRLVGSVLRGTAGAHSDVNLHLFADSLEEILFVLLDRGVDYRVSDKRVRLGNESLDYPAVRFMAGEVEIESVVFPVDGIRQAPACRVDGKPVRRASLAEVEALIGASSHPAPSV